MISAVMPSLNQAAYIREAIDSILLQNYPRLELIVIDGGSTDGTLEILEGYGRRIIWISEPDRNQADALNKGFRTASGEIIAWLNSDDVYAPDAFDTVSRFFMEAPEALWVFGRAIIIDAQGREIRRWITRYKNYFLDRYSYDSLLVQNYISQMAVFFRREIIEEIGFLDVNLRNAMDYDYWLRIGKRYPPAYLDKVLGKFRIHSGSKTVKEAWDLFESDFKCAKKHGAAKPFLVFCHKLFHIAVMFVYPVLFKAETILKNNAAAPQRASKQRSKIMKKILSVLLISAFAVTSVPCSAFAENTAKHGKVTGKSVAAGLTSLLIWPGIGQVINENESKKSVTHALLGLTGIFRFWSGWDGLINRQGGRWDGKI